MADADVVADVVADTDTDADGVAVALCPFRVDSTLI